MPVIECSCGMVMSVPARGPRVCCIRCGGVEFQMLERGENHPHREQILFETTPARQIRPALALIGVEMLELSSGSCI